MKKITKFATLCMALTLCVGLGAFAACNNDGASSSANEASSDVSTESASSAEKTYTAYEFIVKKADGSNADGYQVQLCYGDDGCFNPIPVVDGKCVYTYAEELGAYDVHVLDANYQQVELAEEVVTDATAFGEYTITLKN